MSFNYRGLSEDIARNIMPYVQPYNDVSKYAGYAAALGATTAALALGKGANRTRLRGAKKNKKLYRRAKPYTTKKKQTVKKQIREIQKSLKSDQAIHTNKTFWSGTVKSSVGLCQHAIIGDFRLDTGIETPVLPNLRYYDPSVPGTLVTASAATGTYSRQIHFKNVAASFTVRNNYQVPAKVRVYLCVAKGDTSVTPLTYYTNGITDQVINGGMDQTTPNIFMNDINVLKEQYSIKCLRNTTLMPGKSFSVRHNTGSFDYDPSVYDSHSLTFQKKYKSWAIILRVEGVVGHDSAVSTEQCQIAAGVDYDAQRVSTITYDAGVNLDDIFLVDYRSSSSFTNGGLVSSMPVADNIGYSVA